VEIGEKGIDQIVQKNDQAKNLAKEYGANIAKTPWIEKGLYEKDEVSLNDLKKSAEAMSLDSLLEPWASQEKDELIKIFFAPEGGADATKSQRMKTLLLIMHIIDNCAVLDKKLTKDKLYDSGFVAPMYYREIPLTVNTTAPYVTPIDLKSCAEYWELFTCHYFLTYALESLLEGGLEVAGGSMTGVSIPELIDSLTGQDFKVQLMRETGVSAITPLGYLSWLGAEQIPPSKDDAQKFAQRGTLLSKFSEMKVIEHKCKTPGELTWKGFATILRLYIRWRGRQTEYGFIELSRSALNELWIGNLIPTLDSLFTQNLSWKELAVYTQCR
jgi:hypothetical protein